MNKKLGLLLLLISVGLLTALAAGPVFGSGEDGLKKADAARQKHTATLLANPGVVAVAVGFNPAGEAAVKVYTEDAEVGGIPTKLDGVPVHKQVSGKILALRPGAAPGLAPSAVDTTARFPRPVPIGVSTGHPDITACTIGARLTDGTNVFALSNNHCYADENRASIGDPAIQPGTYDGGASPADDIGTLADFEPIIFGNFGKCLMQGRECNYMDAAVALTSTANVGNSTPVDGYGTPNSSDVAPAPGMPVQKYGRTTGQEYGNIDSINAAVRVGYSSGTATYVDQFIINSTTFSAGGDSGSLILTQNGDYPVGLLFAGSSTTTIGSPIGPILTRFGVTIDASSGPAPLEITTTSLPDGTEGVAYSVTLEANDGVPSYAWVISAGALPAGLGLDVDTGEISGTPTTAETKNFTVKVTDDEAATDTQVLSINVNEADTTDPVISSVAPSNITATSADITWDTNEAADSRADYGIDNSYGANETDMTMVTSHSITLTGLTAETPYHYMATSADGLGNSASSVDFTFTTAAAPTTATTVRVASITYGTEGGKNGDKHLLITVALEDGSGQVVSDASVSISLSLGGSPIGWGGTGTTWTDGTVTFIKKNARSGCYSITVTDVTADGLEWIGGTPENSYGHKASC